MVIEVSVILAVKNERAHIQECMASIQGQAGVALEIIVVDDQSTDGTYELLLALQGVDQRLRVLRNQGKGKVAAFNAGYAVSSGRRVCLFAGDDVMPSDSLLKRVERFPADESVPVVRLCKLLTMSVEPRFDGHLIPRARGRGGLSGQCYMMNRAAAGEIFPIPEELPNEDTWMSLFVLHASGWVVEHSEVIGCHYRIHDGNTMRRTAPFSEVNERLHKRNAAIQRFLVVRRNRLSTDVERRLRVLWRLEQLRYGGSAGRILFVPVGLREKARALFFSRASLCYVRNRFFGIFSGR